MNTLSYKLGYSSSLVLLISFAAWIICFIAIAATSPLFYWTNLQDYLFYVESNSQVFQNIAKFFMLIFGPAWVFFIVSFYEYTVDEKKVMIMLGLLFGLAFAILSSINYFVQLSAVRLNILHGNTKGLEDFLLSNPNSMMTAITMLGWTLFLGLSSLCISTVFLVKKVNSEDIQGESNTLKTAGKGSRIIGMAFMVNGISALLAGIGYIFQIDAMTFIFANVGVGGAVMTLAIASMVWFKRKILQAKE